MRRSLVILLALGLLASFCDSQTRWCSIVGRDASDMLLYPPIARAARVQGVVLSRIYYLPTGQVKGVNTISGPAMLSNSVSDQLKIWTIKTDASGDELCQTLVIADFRLHAPSDPIPAQPSTPVLPSILRLTVDGEALIISDPAGTIGWNPVFHFKYAVKRAILKLFAHRR